MVEITTGAGIHYPFFTASLSARRATPIGIPEELRTLGDHIRKARIERGEYQSDLAKMFRVTPDTVTNWELNRNKVGREYYPIVEKYLGYLSKEFELTELAHKLAFYRWEHNMSIKELGRTIGVDTSCIRSAERGKNSFQKITRKRLQKFINCKIK